MGIVTVKCPKCQTENPDSVKFCGECGTQLKPSKDISVTKTIQTAAGGFNKGAVIAKKYKIIGKLGEGGMGVVYKAKDTRLNRTVALKFLPAELTQNKEAKKRFIQEAQAAAALNHPHICTIYEIDEANEQTFISMEYIEGQSLKDKLKDGPLDIDKAKNVAVQVAEGLKEAHEKAIIHRDIKSANIMLTKKGQAKITDFGLAKLSWGVDLTKPATIMGTVAYMSPEQARGEKVDHRTDIWSFGCVLYEMFSGELPFKSEHEQAVVYSILNEKPESITSISQKVPKSIEQVILKTFEKDPARRPQSMEEVLKNLRVDQSALGISSDPKKSIIVLPFDNISPDPDQEYFCDGMTEEIISDLSKIQALKVISRSSAMTFKGTQKKIKEIAKEVDVTHVLEGSVRKAGNNLRITAQLIDAVDDDHMWAEKYSGTLDDVFDIQEKVSRSIVEALKLKLSAEEKRKIAERPLDDVLAYEYYLKAREQQLKMTKEGLDAALQYLQKGLDVIGENVVLLAGMGYVYYEYINIGIFTDDKYIEKAEEYAQKIFALESDSPYGHLILGLLNIWWKSPQDGIRHLKKVLSHNPNDLDALLWLCVVYANIGQKKAALPLADRFMVIDPLNEWAHWVPGFIQIWDGQFEIALDSFEKFSHSFPDSYMGTWFCALSLAYIHNFKKSCSIFERLGKEIPDNPFVKLGLKFKAALEGNKAEACNWEDREFKIWAWRDFQLCYYVSQICSMVDAKKEALDWLEHSVDIGMSNYPFMFKHDPLIVNIRDEPRFKKLMERVKQEWKNFEV